ncbi:MAG TPA: TetR/AcrR family transcriptional regulator [Candidatus Sulfotelmatobacter sp.]|nr:TetR/AcrR family transcriptional regulator [Candidatus Sulfotelmatobacter sp.]
MSRTVNLQRPAELMGAIVRYLTAHGLSDLSLRPLAKAVGSSPRVLLYYFGSKEKMVTEVLAEMRRQQAAGYDEIHGPSLRDEYWMVWKRMSAPDSVPMFRLFFEAYGIALRRPKAYRTFLRSTVEDWLRLIVDPMSREGYGCDEARAFGTLIVAGLRGFMLDFCNTGDRKRVDRAVEMWLGSLDGLLPKRKGTRR